MSVLERCLYLGDVGIREVSLMERDNVCIRGMSIREVSVLDICIRELSVLERCLY